MAVLCFAQTCLQKLQVAGHFVDEVDWRCEREYEPPVLDWNNARPTWSDTENSRGTSRDLCPTAAEG